MHLLDTVPQGISDHLQYALVREVERIAGPSVIDVVAPLGR